MPGDPDSNEVFEPFDFVPQPTAGCGFVQPEEVSTGQFISDESRDFQLAHLLTCEFCQNKMKRFCAGQFN